ncbi:hypothetical protein TSAR_001619 [Trichomalopsis sarcophagae]|uniref:Uncharacterized protein n=1 Tax=Trichomalopsis sarcophagae TaxID=543379 RepID=A0A232F9L9_9HYME|nr:hypothetical protein TSAR_001619 [Trichomalopsis sarcophagae]
MKATESPTSIATLSTACTWTVNITDLNIFALRITRPIYFNSSVIEDPWHLHTEHDRLPRNDICIHEIRFLSLFISDPEHSESLCSNSEAAVQKHNLKFKQTMKAIPSCITHNSLSSQLQGPTTLEKKIKILF